VVVEVTIYARGNVAEKRILRRIRKGARTDLRRELTVRTVEEGTVSEYLSKPKSEAQEQKRNVKRGHTTPTVTGIIPPIGQVRTDG